VSAETEQFAGRYAVVTGGTQGLGEACARLFAERGAAGLVICGRSAERGRAVAVDISGQGCPTRFVQADLARVEDCRAVIAEADRAFGRLHALVNGAGMTDRGTVWDTTPELWDRIFAVNVRAPFFLMQGAAEIMRREGTPGAVVNVISMSSHGGQPFITAYCASKGALLTLTKNVAFALLRHRIRVNGLNIGWTDTPGEDRIQKAYHDADAGWLARAEADLPLGRLIKPDEVARAVAFLASDESGLMTGAIVDYDQSVLGCYESPPQPAHATAAE
jgi:NAD(P)-dependent dehydrogenase (short-subunit alcohol dehydrogenase family)